MNEETIKGILGDAIIEHEKSLKKYLDENMVTKDDLAKVEGRVATTEMRLEKRISEMEAHVATKDDLAKVEGRVVTTEMRLEKRISEMEVRISRQIDQVNDGVLDLAQETNQRLKDLEQV